MAARIIETSAKFGQMKDALNLYFSGEQKSAREAFTQAVLPEDLFFIAHHTISYIVRDGPASQTREMYQKMINIFRSLRGAGLSLDQEPPTETIQIRMHYHTGSGVRQTIAQRLETFKNRSSQLDAVIDFIQKMFKGLDQPAVKSARKEGAYSAASIKSALAETKGDVPRAIELLASGKNNTSVLQARLDANKKKQEEIQNQMRTIGKAKRKKEKLAQQERLERLLEGSEGPPSDFQFNFEDTPEDSAEEEERGSQSGVPPQPVVQEDAELQRRLQQRKAFIAWQERIFGETAAPNFDYELEQEFEKELQRRAENLKIQQNYNDMVDLSGMTRVDGDERQYRLDKRPRPKRVNPNSKFPSQRLSPDVAEKLRALDLKRLANESSTYIGGPEPVKWFLFPKRSEFEIVGFKPTDQQLGSIAKLAILIDFEWIFPKLLKIQTLAKDKTLAAKKIRRMMEVLKQRVEAKLEKDTAIVIVRTGGPAVNFEVPLFFSLSGFVGSDTELELNSLDGMFPVFSAGIYRRMVRFSDNDTMRLGAWAPFLFDTNLTTTARKEEGGEEEVESSASVVASALSQNGFTAEASARVLVNNFVAF